MMRQSRAVPPQKERIPHRLKGDSVKSRLEISPWSCVAEGRWLVGYVVGVRYTQKEPMLMHWEIRVVPRTTCSLVPFLGRAFYLGNERGFFSERAINEYEEKGRGSFVGGS